MLGYLRDRSVALLRFSERYTKTDMVYLAGNGAWLVLNQIGIGLIALGLSVAFARFVPKDVYGNYRFLLSAFWILTAFSMTGVAPALMRATARGARGIYRAALKESVLWSLPMAFAGAVLAGYYFLNGNGTLAWGAVAIALVGPFMQGAYLYGAYQEGRRAFKGNALAGIALNAAPAAVLLIAMPFVRDAALFVTLYLLANVATGFVISRIVVAREPAASAEDARAFRSDSRHFSFVNALGTVAQQIDRILVFHFLGAVELAVYSFAVALPEQVKGVVGNVEGLAFPKFATQSARSVLGNLWWRLFLFTLALAVIALLYILVAPFVFALLFPSYAEAVVYSQAYALSLVFLGNILPPTLFQAQAAKRELYAFSIITSLVQIGLLVPCILAWGLMGAVVARIIARCFNLVFGLALVRFYALRVSRVPR